jgi:magnesium-transporting ATPase (P-type)
MEKEALRVNDILAKLSQNEKLIGLGSLGVVLGWIVGLFLGERKECAFGYCVGANYFTQNNASLFAILAIVAAIAAIVVLYLKNSSTSINWPMPVTQILLGLAAAALICAALVLVFQITGTLDGAPIGMWIADVILIGGAAVATWGAYQEWLAVKK